MDNAATKIIRVAEGKHSTLSHLYIGGLFCCYLLEDTVRDHKIPGKTAIPPGDYGLSLNHLANMHGTYAKRYPAFHEGMVEIVEIPNYQLVFLHVGNDHEDTQGCPLTGAYWVFIDGDYEVRESGRAYTYMYPQLVAQLNAGNDRIIVENCLQSGVV